MSNNFLAGENIDALTNLQKILGSSGSSAFNCFYSVKDPIGFVNTDVPYNFWTIGWNLLYSLGYIYTDSVAINTEL